MKCLLIAINAKYIHSNLAVYTLKACAERELPVPGSGTGEAGKHPAPETVCAEVELAEYTINHQAAEILDDIYMRKADMLCFSCYIWNIEYVKLLIKNLKRLCPQVPIWLGGPEVSFDLERQLRELPEADGILYGEGERSFPLLVKYYAERAGSRGQSLGGSAAACRTGQEEWPPVPFGCACRGTDGEALVTPPAPFIPMEEIPFVYGDLKKFENRIPYYETSRGCPFSCSYCLSSVDKTLRFRPLSMVFEELSFFLERQVPQVKLVDRTFNCKEQRAIEIWRFLRDNDNGVTNFHFEIEADILGPDSLALLGTLRPGLIQLEIGVQSANGKTLEAIRRRADLSNLKAVTCEIWKNRNIHQHLDLIAGLPWEDYESFGHSFDEVYGMKPDQLQLGFLKVLKGTAMYEEAEKYHILYQAEAPYEVLQTEWLSHGDLIRLKQIEDMVEIYYNSGQFSHTLEALEKLFGRPFLMFEALGRAYKEAGMAGRKHIRVESYRFVLRFVEAHFPEETELFRRLLTTDYYLRENAKKRPEFAPPEPDKETVRNRLAAYRPQMTMKQLLAEYHVERLGEELWLFDYGTRDALTGNASLKRLTEQEEKDGGGGNRNSG